MNKVKMTRFELWEKYGFNTSCDRFCMIRRGHRTVPQKCYDLRFEREMTIHCKEVDKALAAITGMYIPKSMFMMTLEDITP